MELENDLDELGLDDMESEEDAPVSGIPVEVDLCNKYYELLQDSLIRTAVSGVVVSSGRISPSKTRQKLKSWFTENGYKHFEQSQFRILTFLNSIWFIGCDNLSQEFWWTHKNLVLKLVYVCSVAEACNLQQYGLAPDGNCLPRSALYVYDYVISLDDEGFEELEAEFKGLLKTHDDLAQLFLKSFDEAPRGRSKTVEHKTKSKKEHKSHK